MITRDRNPLFQNDRIVRALDHLSDSTRKQIEFFLDRTPGRGWEFIPPEDPQSNNFTYRKILTTKSALVTQHGAGGDSPVTYEMSVAEDLSTCVAPEIIAEAMFALLEAKYGKAQEYRIKNPVNPFADLEASFILPILERPDVLEELDLLSPDEAAQIRNVLSVAGSSKWEPIQPSRGEVRGDTFSYSLKANEVTVTVSKRGDFHDGGAAHEFELVITTGLTNVVISQAHIARELFDTIDAHRSGVELWIDSQAHSEDLEPEVED